MKALIWLALNDNLQKGKGHILTCNSPVRFFKTIGWQGLQMSNVLLGEVFCYFRDQLAGVGFLSCTVHTNGTVLVWKLCHIVNRSRRSLVPVSHRTDQFYPSVNLVMCSRIKRYKCKLLYWILFATGCKHQPMDVKAPFIGFKENWCSSSLLIAKKPIHLLIQRKDSLQAKHLLWIEEFTQGHRSCLLLTKKNEKKNENASAGVLPCCCCCNCSEARLTEGQK